MNVELEMFCNRLLGALINGAYQGLLLTAVIWVALRLVPRANAATRHSVWLVTLLFVAMLPVVHFLLPARAGRQTLGGPASVETDETVADGIVMAHRATFSTAWDEPSAAAIQERQDSADLSAATGRIHGRNRPEERDSVLETEMAPFESHFSASIGSSTPEYLLQISKTEAAHQSIQRTGSANSLLAAPTIPWNWRFPLASRTGVALVGLWAVLASLRIASLARQCWLLHGLKRRGTLAPEGFHKLFEALSEEIGTRRRPRLIMSDESNAPMAVGFQRPAVLLPAKMFEGATKIQLEHVLRHELAHLARCDDWTNLVQQVIKAFLFFHPAVGWLSRRIVVEREIACDDHVLAATRTPRAYALFLTEFAGRMQCRDVAAAPAAWSNKHQLKERITMIMDPNRNSSPRLARARVGALTAVAALIAILGLHVGPRLALAAEKPTVADRDDVAITKETQSDKTVSPPPRHQVESTTESTVSTVTSISVAPRQSIASVDQVPAPLSPVVESSPRPKPQPHVASATTLGPLPPLTAPRPIAAPARAGDVFDQSAPVPPAPPKRRNPGDDSIERRLERLEQMVESLVAKEKGTKKRTDAEHDFKFDLKGFTYNSNVDKELFGKLAEESAKRAEKFSKDGLNQEYLARVQEQTKRVAERAARDVERAAKDVELRALMETQRRGTDANMDEQRRAQAAASRSSSRDSLEKQRKMLEAQRQALEKQMESIERQMERLNQEQERIEEQRVERGNRAKQPDLDTDLSKPEKSRDEDRPKIKK